MTYTFTPQTFLCFKSLSKDTLCWPTDPTPWCVLCCLHSTSMACCSQNQIVHILAIWICLFLIFQFVEACPALSQLNEFLSEFTFLLFACCLFVFTLSPLFFFLSISSSSLSPLAFSPSLLFFLSLCFHIFQKHRYVCLYVSQDVVLSLFSFRFCCVYQVVFCFSSVSLCVCSKASLVSPFRSLSSSLCACFPECSFLNMFSAAFFSFGEEGAIKDTRWWCPVCTL